MKLTEALKKSDVIRRASRPEEVFIVKGNMLIHQGDNSLEPVAFTVEQLSANDWAARVETWIGTAERKPREAKAEKEMIGGSIIFLLAMNLWLVIKVQKLERDANQLFKDSLVHGETLIMLMKQENSRIEQHNQVMRDAIATRDTLVKQ